MDILALARRTAPRLAWLLAAAAIAFGGAGVVAAMDHVPGTTARPELTWAADREARPALDAATDRLEALAAEVDALATAARRALASVTGRDLPALQAARAEGDARVAAMTGAAAAFAASVREVPGVGPGAELRVGEVVRSRYAFLEEATTLTDALASAWAGFDDRAFTAARLATLLDRHDQRSGAAVAAGSEGRYEDALARLGESDAVIAELRMLIDELAPTTDVAAVTDWVDRNEVYDAVLRVLYETVIAAGGQATAEVQAALAAEREARGRLPEDNRALIVIMSDLAQGGLNQALVRIEDARGRLQAAVEIQRELQAGVALPE